MQITTGWNDSFQPFAPRRDGFPLALLRFSQRSAAPPLQACRGASLTPPPGVCPVEGGERQGPCTRVRPRLPTPLEWQHPSRFGRHGNRRVFFPSKLGSALHHIKRRGHDSGCSSTGSPDYSRAKCLQGSVCARVCAGALIGCGFIPDTVGWGLGDRSDVPRSSSAQTVNVALGTRLQFGSRTLLRALSAVENRFWWEPEDRRGWSCTAGRH